MTLSPADIPHDSMLPQLARALDAGQMARIFDAQLGAPQVQACEIERIRYRPRRNCSVSYRLRLQDPRRGGEFEQRVSARFFSQGESLHRHRLAAQRATVASAAGPALTHWPELDMLAHWAPNDAKLDALALLHDEAALRPCLDAVVATLGDGQARLVAYRLALVQHVPESRACARVELRLRGKAGGPASTRRVYVKADLERNGAATHQLMQALGDCPLQAAGRLLTPRPLLWQPALGLHWQLALPGHTLQALDPRIGPAASARVGARLAALHATPLPMAPRRGVDEARQQLRQARALLVTVGPSWRPRLDRLLGWLDDGAEALAREPDVSLHGDLHPGNILLDGARLGFIDLDGLRLGPAVIELGGWVADALYRATLEGQPAARAEASWRAFLGAHAEAAGRAADPRLLAWSAVLQLVCRRACGCVSTLKPGRLQAVPRLLALAEAIAAAGSLDAAAAACTEAA